MSLLKEDDKTLRSGMPAFSTPPPTWQMRRSPMNVRMPNTERKRASPSDSPSCRRDLFHVLHKVPVGNSPYVKAKHVQLIEKDPNRAISLFWAAINAGDRVDSALKDMAVVMKQLSRSDEAIEAIKSFRHLCPIESQESLDNVLLELYKRSGRIEEEIWMLECKLKNIEEGIAFGRKRTKTARSQGKKVQISIEQERARILGNLAWAYLQQHNYGLAERHYRKALSFEPDKNKQCNLAICLMHMNRIPEAKSLLQTVGASIGNQQIDESCSKSFERACQILTKFEAQAGVDASEGLPRFLVVPSSSNENHNFIPRFTDDRVWTGESYCRNFSQNYNKKAFEHSHATSECSLPGLGSSSGSSPSTDIENEWKQSSCYKSPSGQLGSSKKFERGNGLLGKDASLLQKRPTAASPAPILLTQPRPSWWSGEQRRVRSAEDTPGLAVRNLDAELVGSSNDNLDIMSQKPQSTSRGWRRSTTQAATVRDKAAQGTLSVPNVQTSPELCRSASIKGEKTRDYGATIACGAYGVEDSNNTPQHLIRTRETRASGDSVNADSLWNPEVIVFGSLTTTTAARDDDVGNKISTKSASKCWADMVEEEEEEEESNNENLNSNVLINQFQSRGIESVSQKLDAVGISKDDASANSVSKKSGVRRSLCFEKERDTKKNGRLQVFKDITPSLDSP